MKYDYPFCERKRISTKRLHRNCINTSKLILNTFFITSEYEVFQGFITHKWVWSSLKSFMIWVISKIHCLIFTVLNQEYQVCFCLKPWNRRLFIWNCSRTIQQLRILLSNFSSLLYRKISFMTQFLQILHDLVVCNSKTLIWGWIQMNNVGHLLLF